MTDLATINDFRNNLPAFETRDDIRRAAVKMTHMLNREIDGDLDCEIIRVKDDYRNEIIASTGEISEGYRTYPMVSNEGDFYGLLHFSHDKNEVEIEIETFLNECTNIMKEACEKVRNIRENRRDSLTGALEKEHVENNVVPDIITAEDEFGFMLFDIDDFSRINNEYSHDAGDYVLRSVVDLLKQSTPKLKDTYISRLGGEEFGVILRDVGSEETERIGREIADNIRSQTFSHNDKDITVTISGGVVHYPSDAEITNDIFQKADNACYKSKVLGKDRVTYSRNVVDLESASKYHITKEFKDELGDIYDSFEIHEFLRQITIAENGQAALNERRILTQKDAEANGFPVIVMSDGEVSGWDSTKANIKYVSRDGDNCWIVGLEIPEYIQETNNQYEVDFNCSLGNAYSEDQETHVTDLTLYEPPVRIDDSFKFPDGRAVQDAWIEEYSTEEEEFVELQSGTVSNKEVTINEGDLSVALEVESTPSILRTVWEW